MKKYTVKNVYGVAGESRHRSFKRALAARDAREGAGWAICDDAGNQVEPNKVARNGGGWDEVPAVMD